MRIIIARHTQTGMNMEKCYSGQIDVPLNHEGVLQAQALAHLLSDIPIGYAYSSDLVRAKQTLRILVGNREAEVASSHLLRELDVGIAAGLSREEALARFRNEQVDTRHKNPDFTSIGGENKLHVLGRYHQIFTRIHEKHREGGKVGLVVCHGTALRYYLTSNPNLAGLRYPEQGEYLEVDLDTFF
ncbi:MAG: histidine phosphatase family protein [Patescibacteria group bacterium]